MTGSSPRDLSSAARTSGCVAAFVAQATAVGTKAPYVPISI